MKPYHPLLSMSPLSYRLSIDRQATVGGGCASRMMEVGIRRPLVIKISLSPTISFWLPISGLSPLLRCLEQYSPEVEYLSISYKSAVQCWFEQGEGPGKLKTSKRRFQVKFKFSVILMQYVDISTIAALHCIQHDDMIVNKKTSGASNGRQHD
jgi:hypothetical protein